MSLKKEASVLLRCKAGKIEEFKKAVGVLVRETEKEPGCELFRIFQNKEQPDQFVLWEIFSNEEAMREHMEKHYTKEMFALNLFEPVSTTHLSEIR